MNKFKLTVTGQQTNIEINVTLTTNEGTPSTGLAQHLQDQLFRMLLNDSPAMNIKLEEVK